MNSTNLDINENIEVVLGSDEFYKMLHKIPETNRPEFFNNSEINFLEYKYSCDYDRRTFMQIFSSILKEENNIIYSFSFCANDYNLSLVKFSFLIIQIILLITFSCLFFVNDIIIKIYDKKYKIDRIIYLLKPIIFTFVISLLINILLKALSKINNNVIDIKNEKLKYKDGLTKIRLKLIFYFSVSFIFMSFGWILVSCFGLIFRTIQIKILICAGFILVANFILQIIFCFIIASLRMCSLNSEKKGHRCLYNFSTILTYL